MSNPLGSAPDEAIQGATAYATVHGDIADLHPSVPPIFPEMFNKEALFCLQKSWDTAASCQDWSVIDGPNRPMFSQFGSYNPVYYFLVGWPTLLLDGRASVYAMRLVSSIIVSLLLAAAVAVAWSDTRMRFATVGPLLALAPTVLFLGGAINPNSLEIAAAVLAWSGFLATLSASAHRRSGAFRASVTLTTIGLSLLLVTRLMSPLWAFILVVATVTATGRWREFGGLLISSRYFQAHVAVLAVPAAWALGWSLTHPTVFSGGGGVGDYADSFGEWLRLTLEGILIGFPSLTFVQVVGIFGWTSFSVPLVALVFAALWGGLVAATYSGSDTRGARWTACLLPAFCVIFPAALAALMWSGKGWQGRYILPVAVGVPILCVWLLADRVDRARRGTLPLRRALRGGTIAVVSSQLISFVFYFKRNAVGWGRSWDPRDFTWSPPLGPWLWLGLLVLGSTLLCRLAWLATRKQMATQPDPISPAE